MPIKFTSAKKDLEHKTKWCGKNSGINKWKIKLDCFRMERFWSQAEIVENEDRLIEGACGQMGAIDSNTHAGLTVSWFWLPYLLLCIFADKGPELSHLFFLPRWFSHSFHSFRWAA